MSHTRALPKRTFSKYKEPRILVPDLIQNQIDSFNIFLREGLLSALSEFSPIEDYAKKKFSLELVSFELLPSEFDEYYAKENKMTFEGTLKARIKLVNKIFGTEQEQEISFAEIPLMTNHGTFIINGVERVIVPQLARSYGAFIIDQETRKGQFFGAKLIPARGVWVDMSVEHDGVLYSRIDSKRKFPITTLLRAMGLATDESILGASQDEHYQKLIGLTLAKDEIKTADEAFVELYKRMRDGEHATVDNAREFVQSVFSADRYDFTHVGRYQINKRFNLGLEDADLKNTSITITDIIKVIETVAFKQVTPGEEADDIDHLGMRRVRYVGEMLEQKVRKGMAQVKRNIQDRMSTIDAETVQPLTLINQRPLQARIKEFFAQNQLSQFMEQENILSELEHVRTVSALGPGGLTRERAGFEVRDIHPSHYGRVCPVHTPEGQNIGLILRMAIYARINEFGMIETPYIRVEQGKLTGEVVFLNAFEEERYHIAHWGVRTDDKGSIVDDEVEIRFDGNPKIVSKKDVHFIDVAANQIFSVATSLIPFVESDAANRALMGSNMQKQATPVISPDVPIVATGMEFEAARNSGRLVVADFDGEVTAVDSTHVTVKSAKETKDYSLVAFQRTNDYSCFHHRPIVAIGQKVTKGDILADASMTQNGELALGQNCTVAFMCWRGQNFEDAIILSERLVKNGKFSSIRIEEHECIVRDTKLGAEQTTSDIPNVSDSKLRNLDEDGIVRVGSEVVENDILVGKITPKGETELTPEERLLRSIFGDKARDVKDTSLRMGYGKRGRVIGVKVFSRDKGDELESGVLKKIYIEIAQIRHVQVGDKLAGRHGNKGVISIVLPEEDMPYMADGTPVDVVLTPLGVPSRMNLGQILELHLGMAAQTLGYQAIVPPFSSATETEIKDELEKAGFDRSGKVVLFDGLTGEAFEQPVSVGVMHILKLHHMVDDKMHARAIGPYSLITQQPLGGKSQSGGQRFGEMEVWALEGYGAAYTLREMLTIKSDDIQGRSETFEAIIRGNQIGDPHTPASFKVLMNYLRGLSFDVKMNYESGAIPSEFDMVKPQALVEIGLEDEELLVDDEAFGIEALSLVEESSETTNE
jgi:DNA-directed RNA polymerase subunit beta